MRKLSRMMVGLLLSATLIAPVAVQAQENGRGRGGDGGGRGGWQAGGDRGGGDRGGWRGGGDRGATINGDARREAIQQAREAQRQVERPAPLMQPGVAAPERRPEYRGDRDEGNRAGASDGRAQEFERRTERRREMVTEGSRWNNRGDRDAGDRSGRYGDRGDARRDRDRGPEGDRNWTGDRRDWGRDRDDNRDVDRRWTGDRRDWGRDGHRSWSSDRRDWDRRDHRDWKRDWRGDRRYGWQNYRNSHRHIYRLPRYEARHGHSYRRWYPGYRWDSWFYSSSFWINDPWQYRLPPAYGPYRWVRYYDDVVLVDIDTGEIVDIIYDFFW